MKQSFNNMNGKEWSFLIVRDSGSRKNSYYQLSVKILVGLVFVGIFTIGGYLRGIYFLSGYALNYIAAPFHCARNRRLTRDNLRIERYMDAAMNYIISGQVYNKHHRDCTSVTSIRKVSHVNYGSIFSTNGVEKRAQAGAIPDLRVFYEEITESQEIDFSTIPSLCPTEGHITSPFGIRSDPIFEGTAFHKGIDIAYAMGSPIQAAADGIVIVAGPRYRWGNVIIIDHFGNGYTTIYAHLSGMKVVEEDTVQKGDVIGYLGSTGKATGPHLHYEVRYKNKAVDPLTYLLPLDSIAD